MSRRAYDGLTVTSRRVFPDEVFAGAILFVLNVGCLLLASLPVTQELTRELKKKGTATYETLLPMGSWR